MPSITNVINKMRMFYHRYAEDTHKVAALSIPIVVYGDKNVRLDRSKDVWTIHFTDMLTSFGPEQRVNQLSTRTAFHHRS